MKTAYLTSIIYAIAQITGGLFLHPYQTMQSLAQDKVFSWLTLLPILVFILSKVVWIYLIVPMVQFVFSCSTTYFFGCDLIPFFANWLLLFCIYWQVLLIYLFLRFTIIFQDA
jgi:hypothetical protein